MADKYLEKIFKNLVDNKVTTIGTAGISRAVTMDDLDIFNYLPTNNLKLISIDDTLYKCNESLYLFYDKLERSGKLLFEPYIDGNSLVLNHKCAVVYDKKNKFVLRYANGRVRAMAPFELIESDELDEETLYMLLVYMCCNIKQFKQLLEEDNAIISTYIQKITGDTGNVLTRDSIFSNIKRSSFDELSQPTEKYRLAAHNGDDYARWYLSEDSRYSIVVFPNDFESVAYEIYLPDSQVVSMIRTLFLLSVAGIKINRNGFQTLSSYPKRIPALGFREFPCMTGSKELVRIFEVY